MLPLFMSMCMRWGSGSNCCLCSFPCVCVREVGVNVASVHRHMYVLRRVNVSRVHVHVLGRSMLPLVMSMCMCLGEGNVVAVHVASVHVNAHVLNADQCCLCSWPCVKGDNFSSVHIHVLGVSVASINVNVYVGFLLEGGIVAAVQVHVYVLGGQCCLRTCRCVCY